MACKVLIERNGVQYTWDTKSNLCTNMLTQEQIPFTELPKQLSTYKPKAAKFLPPAETAEEETVDEPPEWSTLTVEFEFPTWQKDVVLNLAADIELMCLDAGDVENESPLHVEIGTVEYVANNDSILSVTITGIPSADIRALVATAIEDFWIAETNK